MFSGRYRARVATERELMTRPLRSSPAGSVLVEGEYMDRRGGYPSWEVVSIHPSAALADAEVERLTNKGG